MSDGLPWHRIQFAFSITFHYLFPQLTMGLALLIVVFKSLALRLRDNSYKQGRPVLGPDLRPQLRHGGGDRHPDGVPVRHRLDRFSRFSGEVIGQALALEGVFAFFLESTFLGLFLFWREATRPEAAPRRGRRLGNADEITSRLLGARSRFVMGFWRK